MGTIKALSAKEIRRVAGICGKQYQKVQWHSAQFVVRHSISIDEYVDLIRNVVADCTTEHGIVYELFDFSHRVNVVSAYAFVELPEDVDDVFYIMYNTDLYETVCRYANAKQIESSRQAAFRCLYRECGAVS